MKECGKTAAGGGRGKSRGRNGVVEKEEKGNTIPGSEKKKKWRSRM